MTYFPFGAGPRSCIGNHFALQELMIMVVLFYRHYRCSVAPGFVVAPDPLITLRPKYGMKMHVHARAHPADVAQQAIPLDLEEGRPHISSR